MAEIRRRRVGIIGYGNIGKALYQAVLKSNTLELEFVWNRTIESLKDIPEKYVIKTLEDVAHRNVDLIVEVAHISITYEYGEKFLEKADYMIGSPTALADIQLETKLRQKALSSGHGLYVPAGAFWGGEDVAKMADLGTLQSVKVTMRKHPDSFKVLGELAERNARVGDEPVILYEGPVRNVCPLAPANVNTMACAALAAHNLGFDQVQGCLVADRSLNCHIVEIEVKGAAGNSPEPLVVHTVRRNPCAVGAVTGNATLKSFVASLERAHGKGAGIHLC